MPNIANYILDNMPNEFNLTGLALGNACWGGDANTVNCNGPNSDHNDIDMYFGKGLISKKLYTKINDACKWPKTGVACEALLEAGFAAVGPRESF